MSTVYLVEGSIDDGMRGIPFTVGVFTDLARAQEAVRSIKERSSEPDTWVDANGQYLFHYCLDITPLTMDQVRLPKDFK